MMATFRRDGGNRNRKLVSDGALSHGWGRSDQQQSITLRITTLLEDSTDSHTLTMSATEAVQTATYIAKSLTGDQIAIKPKDTRTDAEVLRALADAIEAGTDFA